MPKTKKLDLKQDESQFHYGSIKMRQYLISDISRCLSQFHYGSIKILCHSLGVAVIKWGLNSTMVRLKFQLLLAVITEHKCSLNSTMVRLKSADLYDHLGSYSIVSIPLWFD